MSHITARLKYRRTNAERDLDNNEADGSDEDVSGDEEDGNEILNDEDAELLRLRANSYLEEDETTLGDQVDDEVEEVGEAMECAGAKKTSKQKEQIYTIYEPKTPRKWNTLVCDEAHLLKNTKSAIHKATKCCL
ncbi:hypothetical protein F4680DRAFT_446296 [Xylaria scruposa]|nr:hypothetical protein F4680DRAFT_446296 [Xylaria scruposa]